MTHEFDETFCKMILFPNRTDKIDANNIKTCLECSKSKEDLMETDKCMVVRDKISNKQKLYHCTKNYDLDEMYHCLYCFQNEQLLLRENCKDFIPKKTEKMANVNNNDTMSYSSSLSISLCVFWLLVIIGLIFMVIYMNKKN